MSANLPAGNGDGIPDWVKWLAEGHIPGAAKAVAKLVGSVADAGTEWVSIVGEKGKQWRQSIADDSKTSTAIKRALAKAGAEHAVTDIGLIERTIRRSLPENIIEQQNREAVAELCVEYLRTDDTLSQEVPAPEDDWMNVFSSYAGKASSERMRETWARVLAGKIRQPRTFSLRTMLFISTLDADIASDFQHLVDRVFQGCLVPTSTVGNRKSANIIRRMTELGLVGGVGYLQASYPPEGLYLFDSPLYSIRYISMTEGSSIRIRVFNLTELGKQIYSIAAANRDIEVPKLLAEGTARDSGASHIEVFERRSSSELEHVEMIKIGRLEALIDESRGDWVGTRWLEWSPTS